MYRNVATTKSCAPIFHLFYIFPLNCRTCNSPSLTSTTWWARWSQSTSPSYSTVSTPTNQRFCPIARSGSAPGGVPCFHTDPLHAGETCRMPAGVAVKCRRPCINEPLPGNVWRLALIPVPWKCAADGVNSSSLVIVLFAKQSFWVLDQIHAISLLKNFHTFSDPASCLLRIKFNSCSCFLCLIRPRVSFYRHIYCCPKHVFLLSRLLATQVHDLPLTLQELTSLETSFKQCALNLYGPGQVGRLATGFVNLWQKLCFLGGFSYDALEFSS